MKSIKIAVCGFLCAMLAGSVMAGFVYDTFTGSQGTSITNFGWYTTSPSTVGISNLNSRSAVAIPIMQSVSNVPGGLGAEKRIWTDFYTIPRPFVSTLDGAPTVDANASAQFFVSSNGQWVIIHKVGGVLSTDTVSAVNSVTNDGVTWQHVSVLHNYNSNTWSLLVNDQILAANKGFIGNQGGSYTWFNVENGGGNATNVTWLDDVLITNRVPNTLTNSLDGDPMSDAWELMYLGGTNVSAGDGDSDGDGYTDYQEAYLGMDGGSSSEAPTAGQVEETVFNSTNAGIVSLDITNGLPLAMRLGFNVGSNRIYQVLRSSIANGSYTLIGSFFTGENGQTNSYVDTNALTALRYYYRLAATNGPFAQTNADVYVFYQQSRAIQSGASNFWTGVMVDYGVGNTMASTLGSQLKQGLTGGTSENNADMVIVYNPSQSTFWLDSGRNWVELDEETQSVHLDTPIPLGTAMLIRRRSSGGSPDGTNRAVYAGGYLTTEPVSITANTGWNMFSWPREGSNIISVALGDLSKNVGATMWLYRNGQYKQLRKYADAWRLSGGGSLVGSPWNYVQFGEGFFYISTNAVPGIWEP